MRLVSFAVRNYRSIALSSKISLKDSTTALIGPNNEGKSNVLRALVVALSIASQLDRFRLGKYGRLRQGARGEEGYYRWETDFPLKLQQQDPNGRSEFDLEFALSPKEIPEFKAEVGSSLNGTLPIQLSVGRDEPKFKVIKKGPGAKTLSEKAAKIAAFIGKRIDFVYIPAVRTASTAESVVESIVSRELQELNDHPDFKAAIGQIESLQRPILARISESIRDTLKVFLPSVKDVTVEIAADARYRAWTRGCEVIVDDGIPTELAKKGDGVQSLAALGLLRHASQTSAGGKQLILTIEEPESHLHSRAIHQLRSVLADVASQHQVVITTHCPLFVDRRDVASNILVENNKAMRATSIRAIRESLGVRVSDNLQAAEVVLFVEGEEDRAAMRALLAHHSLKLKNALGAGVLAIDSLQGGTNLAYKAGAARDEVCTPHALMDYDLSGKAGVDKAVKNGLLSIADVSYTSCLGMSESEIEDWYDPDSYAKELSQQFGVPAISPHYSSTKKKWVERMKDLFVSSGKGWNQDLEAAAKRAVGSAVAANPGAALLPSRKSAFDVMVAALEAKLGK